MRTLSILFIAMLTSNNWRVNFKTFKSQKEDFILLPPVFRTQGCSRKLSTNLLTHFTIKFPFSTDSVFFSIQPNIDYCAEKLSMPIILIYGMYFYVNTKIMQLFLIDLKLGSPFVKYKRWSQFHECLSSTCGISALYVLMKNCISQCGNNTVYSDISTYSFGQLSIHHEIVHMFFCFGKF